LKSLDKLPKDPKDLPEAFKKHLIEEQKLNPIYEEVLDRVIGMKKMMNDKKLDKIPERDIHTTKEYVRRFLGSIRDIIKERDLEKQKIPEVPLKGEKRKPSKEKKTKKEKNKDDNTPEKEKTKTSEKISEE